MAEKASPDDVKTVRLSYCVLHLRGPGDATSDVLLSLLDDIHVILHTPFKEEDLHNVLVEVDSGAYTVIFASVSAASFASSSRPLKSSGVQRSRTWPNGVPGLPPEVDSKVQAETLGIQHTASVLDRAHLAGTPFALLGREHFPSCNIDEDVAFWSQPDIMDLNGKKGIYSGAFYTCELAKGVGCTPGRFLTNSRALSRRLYLGEPCWRPSGSNTVYVEPLPRACICQHSTEHANLPTGTSQDFNNFYSSALAGAVFDILTGLGALRAGVSSPLSGRSAPCLPSSAPSLEVERQAPLRVPGRRAAVVGESTLRQGEVDPNTSVPIIAPIRGCVEDVRRLKRGDVYVGRGSRERGLEKGIFCNPYTVRQYGRDRCIDLFGEHLAGNRGLQDRLLELSGRRLLCHCKAHERCHADELIRQFLLKYPEAYVMGLSDDAPPQEVALAMAWARQEVDDGEVSGTSSEDEPLFPTHLGRGPRMTVGSGPSFRDVRDGCGRWSPGLWPLADRRFPTDPLWLDLSRFLWEAASNLTTDGLLRDLALGPVVESPFAPRDVAFLKRHLEGRLARGGHLRRQEAEDGIAVTLDWALFAALLRLSGDPEGVTMGSFAAGVRKGVGIRLPRARGIFERKVKWLGEIKPEDERLAAGCREELVFQDNYQSALESMAGVRRVVQSEIELGRIQRWTLREATAVYGQDLRFGSLLELFARVSTLMVFPTSVCFTTVRGGRTDVNTYIRVRDRDETPAAADIKRVLREAARGGLQFRGLVVDVKGAHCLILVARSDWKYQCFQLPGSDDVYLNTVGTFGIRSASYWWSRAGSALVRLAYYVVGDRASYWNMLVADDMGILAAGHGMRPALTIVLILAACLDVPLSWLKIKGGETLLWVGYEILLAEFRAGISATRAAWDARWCTDLVDKGRVHMNTFEEGLGRLTFISGMLDWDRSFMAPLYVFMNVAGRDVVADIPFYALMALKFLAKSIPHRRHLPCGVFRDDSSLALRVDAHATETEASVGGWLPVKGVDGAISVWDSFWFMLQVTPESHPWAFLRKGEPKRVIGALEAYAALLAIKVLPITRVPDRRGTIAYTQVLTDNRANGYILSRLSTTSFPTSALTMELALELKSRGMSLEASWIPRELNVEA